ncbi:MAG: thioesterase, partial [Acidimicrobiales bacterium]|nr:thioesterase [Acidimicrobiales bacterium]
MPLHPGLSAEVQLTVSDADTAIAVGSGTVPVLATPRVIALCEETSVKAMEDDLEPGTTTVGMRV